ncbi:MAG: hypothetical protein IT236_03630 [Bacteroidia bacterium]|nr:hypothetical protein [Bacteroidia bacterium]
MKNRIGLVLLMAFLYSCQSNEPQINQKLSNQLIGEWRSVTMKLQLKTYKNSPSEKIVEVNENNWAQKLNMQPIRTFYRVDGTYNSLHLNLRDSAVLNPSGRWTVIGDTLHMMDTFPQRAPVFKYKLVLKGNELELFGNDDLDNDGQADDVYYSKQRKNLNR